MSELENDASGTDSMTTEVGHVPYWKSTETCRLIQEFDKKYAPKIIREHEENGMKIKVYEARPAV